MALGFPEHVAPFLDFNPCFPEGVTAHPLDSRSQGFHPLDPASPPSPLSNKWRGGTASRAGVGWPRQRSGEPIFWMPILEGA